MNDDEFNPHLKNFLFIFLFGMTINLPPHLYSTFDADRFIGWSSYLGGGWFSEMAERMQLNYGCAPSEMLANIMGFAFWYAVIVLALASATVLYGCRMEKVSYRAALPSATAIVAVGACLIYFDAVLSQFSNPYICRTVSLDVNEVVLADEIVRHLCNNISLTMLGPAAIVGLPLLIGRWLLRRSKMQRPSLK
jgi:hypothetical protein